MKKIITLLSILIFVSCQTSKKPNYSKASENSTTEKKSDNSQNHPGKKLMETNCYVCHSPSASHENRIAPPMIAIKKHYISSNTTKKEFKIALQHWMENPTKEKAKMFGAVKKFGVMPKILFPKETIYSIADYMFDYDIDQPEWFDEHYKNERGKNKKEIGLNYVLTTKSVLGKNLMGKLQKEGTIAALKFCNEKAYPLTDSMSVYHKAKIKRVSDKPRNANNLANAKETEYIELFKKDLIENKESEPIIVESNGTTNFYYPIKTNDMCLKCHGKPKTQIKENTLKEIHNLYPKDKAQGYASNQIRGVWSISFN
ncbi:DUF3365 domain-containing protein [Bacteroidota bacterium]